MVPIWTLVAATTIFFPLTLTRSDPCTRDHRPARVVSAFEAEWYGKQLTAAREPSLYERSLGARPPEGTTLRFTWLRSFHPTIVVRIEGLDGPAPRLVSKQLSGAGGYAPGTITRQVDRKLSDREASTVAALLAREHPFDAADSACSLGTDGAQWPVESVDRGAYSVVQRWSPDSGAVRALGLALLDLTGWHPQPVY